MGGSSSKPPIPYTSKEQVDRSWVQVQKDSSSLTKSQNTLYNDQVNFWYTIFDFNYDAAIYQYPNLSSLASYINTLFSNIISLSYIISLNDIQGRINTSSAPYILKQNADTINATYQYIYIYAYTFDRGGNTQNILANITQLKNNLAYTNTLEKDSTFNTDYATQS